MRFGLVSSEDNKQEAGMLKIIHKGDFTPLGAFRQLKQAEAVPAVKPELTQQQERIDSVLKELDNLIGLYSVKRMVKELQAYVMIQRYRRTSGLLAESTVLHMVFTGNPGTGKTTIARILGNLFKEIGVLPQGHLVEIERADIVGEYIGHTAQKTRDQIKKAVGGILFIDEAYSLARGGEKDFGKEAIDTLVKAMEDNKDKMIIILAGYPNEMEEFIKSNPGLNTFQLWLYRQFCTDSHLD